MQNNRSDLCEGPLLKKIILYTVPIILTGILQLLFNAADLVVVGRYCGELSVAAVGATGALINLIINLFIGLSVGAGVTVAHGLGAGKEENVRRTVHTAIPTAIICGIILTVVGVAGAHTFLSLMGTPDEVIGLSAEYLRIYFCGITATMLYNFGAAILRAAGDTQSPLYYLTAAGIVNVVLNIVFVRVFNMNVAGVALATTISQVLSAAMIIINLMRRTDCCRLELRKMKLHRAQLSRILRIGFPAGIQGSLFAVSNVIIQSSVNSFGSVVVSGNAAAGNIEGFVYTTMNSFSQTSMNFTGQNYGAGKLDRIKKIMYTCLASVFVAGLTAGCTVYFFGRQLLSFYIPGSEEAIHYGLIRMAYICLPYFLCGLMDVTTGLIRGLGSSMLPMIITVIGVCGMRIGWIYTVFRSEKYHSVQSLYLSYAISWSLTFITELIVFLVLFKKIKNRKKSASAY